jgi:hypothetical protein
MNSVGIWWWHPVVELERGQTNCKHDKLNNDPLYFPRLDLPMMSSIRQYSILHAITKYLPSTLQTTSNWCLMQDRQYQEWSEPSPLHGWICPWCHPLDSTRYYWYSSSNGQEWSHKKLCVCNLFVLFPARRRDAITKYLPSTLQTTSNWCLIH